MLCSGIKKRMKNGAALISNVAAIACNHLVHLSFFSGEGLREALVFAAEGVPGP